MGVPTLGCGCAVCTSADPRDKRLRPSVMVRWHAPDDTVERERVVVIDTGPDFREQVLRSGVRRIDAVFYTHSNETRATLERIFDYTFSPDATYPNRARLQLVSLAESNLVYGVDFRRVSVMHGALEIVGYRFGSTAYLTDVSAIPEASFSLLEGLDHLVLSALRHKPHPNHATVEQAVGWAQKIGARQTWLTHIAHELGHEQTNCTLPSGVVLAYDGLTVPVTL